MFKYIKWELKNFLNKKYGWFIFVAAIYLLTAIFPLNSSGFVISLVHLAFGIIIFVTFYGAFFFGTRKVVNTFSKKTFLLESMIPYPEKKILLAKFILGIALNLLISIIGIIGLLIVLFKESDLQTLMKFFEFFFSRISISDFLRFAITYMLSTIAVMSIIVFGFILAKVIKPGGKGSTAIGIFISIFIFYTLGWCLLKLNLNIEHPELFIDLFLVCLSVISFYATSWLIENKLEIYN